MSRIARAVVGCIAAVICCGAAFADIAYLQEAGRLTSPAVNDGVVNQITFCGDYLYYSLDAGGFEIRNRYTLQVLSNIRTSFNAYTTEFAVDGNYAYLAEWTGGLTVLDIRNKYYPIVVGKWGQNLGYAQSLKKIGDRVLMGVQGKGVYTLNVADPRAPVQTGLYITGYPADLVRPAASNRLIMGGYQRLMTFSIANIDHLVHVWEYPMYPGYGVTYDRGHNLVITTCQYTTSDVLKIFDATNVDNMPLLVEYQDPDPLPKGGYHQIRGITTFGNYIMYIDADYGVNLLDATDIYNMQKVACFEKPEDVRQLGNTITIMGNYAYVGTRGSGIIMLDMSDYLPLCTTSTVPEPSVALALIPALAGLAGFVRARNKQ
jgi:hypothetical protein